jgi:hypothetical protein
MEIGRQIPVGALLPSVTPKSVAVTDANGKFVLLFRTSRPWMVDVEEPSVDGFVGGSARFSVPEAMLKYSRISLSLLIVKGGITPVWSPDE